jgi:hypothetical protein
MLNPKTKFMEKRLKFLIFLLLAAPVLFIGCQKSELADDSTLRGDNSVKSTVAYTPCGTPLIANLYQYGNTGASFGTVTVGNDLVNLYITYELGSGSVIQNTYLYVGTSEDLINMAVPYGLPNSILPNGTGEFRIGFFPYIYAPYPVSSSYTKVIPLGSLPDCFIIVAFADIGAPGAPYTRVSAKAPTTFKSAGYYLDYCKQICGGGGCETAYAFGNNVANCFLTIPGVTSNNWGWSNGPIGAGTYSWPIYAGAGQCNTANGTLVGTLNVTYTPPTAIITYSMGASCHLNATHLYVGNTILPLKKGKYTTAPGQFPYKHENLNGVSSDTFTINGLSGNIYIAAHSEVCW